MDTQNQIKRTLAQADAVDYVREQLDSRQFINRTRLASFLCTHFDFHDIRGDKQLGGCLKALRELEAAGQFIGIGRFRPQNGGFYGRFRISKLKLVSG